MKKKIDKSKIYTFLTLAGSGIILAALIVWMWISNTTGARGTYYGVLKRQDTEYFKSEVVCKPTDCSCIVKNEVTGKYYLAIFGGYGISMVEIGDSDDFE